MSEKNPHIGHRQRLKQRYLSYGIDGFTQHQALELLLFYAIPYKDTNPLAHKLLDEFGTISAVFDATKEQLHNFGLTDNQIALIKMIPDYSRLYLTDKSRNGSTVIQMDKLCDFFINRFVGRTEEYLYLLLIDSKFKELYSGVVSKGSFNTAEVPIRKIVQLALEYNARYVVIAHNHPTGLALPSAQDIDTTNRLYHALYMVHVRLFDHIIVADNDAVSLANSNYKDLIIANDIET